MTQTDFKELKRIRSVPDIMSCVLKVYRQEMNAVGDKKYESTGSKPLDHFEELLKYLTITQKGLTDKELEQLANIGQNQVRLGLDVFEHFLLSVNGCYKLYNEHITEYVQTRWIASQHMNLCKTVSEVLESTPNSMRKLEEQIYVLIESKSWFQLKQTISTIENFLILFNPDHKFALGSCWGTLVAQHYDPVVEYNKSLELFEMHYQPSIEDLFRIVLQLSRFFKELVDFENPDSLPEFKHPSILNRFLTGDHNPKFQKHKKSSKHGSSQAEKTQQTNASLAHSESEVRDRRTHRSPRDSEDFRLRPEEFSIESLDNEVMDHDAGVCVNYLADIGLLRELKRMIMYDQSGHYEILNQVEKINVDIPGGREKYLDYFRHLIACIKEKKRPASLDDTAEGSKADSVMNPQQSGIRKQSTLEIRSRPTSIYNSIVSRNAQPSAPQNTNKLMSSQVSRAPADNTSILADKSQLSSTRSKLRQKLNQKSSDPVPDEALETGGLSATQNPEVSTPAEGDQKLSFYFYKRWLWIMFPWACMNIHDNNGFSSQIKKCFTSNIKYIKVKDELELTRLALGIAIKAKMKKKSVLNTLRGDFLMDERLTDLESQILKIQTQRTSVGQRGTETSGGFGSSFPIHFDGADEIAIAHELTSERLKQQGEYTEPTTNPSGFASRKNTAQHLKTLIANSQSVYTNGNMETTASRGIHEGSLTTRSRQIAASKTASQGFYKAGGGKAQIQNGQTSNTRLFFPTAVDAEDPILEQSREQLDQADRSRTQGEMSFKRSFRSQRAGSASATKCLNALSFSNLELNMMNNACNTPLQQVVGMNLSSIKDSLGVQRMIRDVRGALFERTQRETQFLNNKNHKMVAALNDMKHQNALQLQKLDNLRRELKKDGLCIVRQNNTAGKVSTLKARCARTQEKLSVEMKQQERLKRIIEICTLNKDANEDCTRQLNYLVANLDKLAKILEKQIQQLDKEGDSLEELIKSTSKAQKEKAKNTDELLEIVNSNFETQKKLDKDFMETNISWVEGNTAAPKPTKFSSTLLKEQQSYTNGPIVQKKKEELGTERDNVRLLEEFREDLLKLSEVFKVSPQEMMATRGKLSTMAKFKGNCFLTRLSVICQSGAALGEPEEDAG